MYPDRAALNRRAAPLATRVVLLAFGLSAGIPVSAGLSLDLTIGYVVENGGPAHGGSAYYYAWPFLNQDPGERRPVEVSSAGGDFIGRSSLPGFAASSKNYSDFAAFKSALGSGAWSLILDKGLLSQSTWTFGVDPAGLLMGSLPAVEIIAPLPNAGMPADDIFRWHGPTGFTWLLVGPGWAEESLEPTTSSWSPTFPSGATSTQFLVSYGQFGQGELRFTPPVGDQGNPFPVGQWSANFRLETQSINQVEERFAPVPEPAGIAALTGAGLLLLGGGRRWWQS